MSYAKVTSKILVEFPGSEALHDGWFDSSNNLVGVSFNSNPAYYYEHEVNGWEEFQALLEEIDYQGSAKRGYDAWKNTRKARFQKQDRARFDELWEDLNEYQRQNFVEWFSEKAKEFDPVWSLPIYVRKQKFSPWR